MNKINIILSFFIIFQQFLIFYKIHFSHFFGNFKLNLGRFFLVFVVFCKP